MRATSASRAMTPITDQYAVSQDALSFELLCRHDLHTNISLSLYKQNKTKQRKGVHALRVRQTAATYNSTKTHTHHCGGIQGRARFSVNSSYGHVGAEDLPVLGSCWTALHAELRSGAARNTTLLSADLDITDRSSPALTNESSISERSSETVEDLRGVKGLCVCEAPLSPAVSA